MYDCLLFKCPLNDDYCRLSEGCQSVLDSHFTAQLRFHRLLNNLFFMSSSLFWTPYQLASKLCFYIKEASGAAGFIGFPQDIKEVACDIWEAQLSNGWSIGLILGAFGITRVSCSQSESACIVVSMSEELFVFKLYCLLS